VSHSFEEELRHHVTQPILKALERMSQSISEQQDANTAAIVADLAVIRTGIETLQAQLAAGSGTAGTTITQAQEDALTAARQTADALVAGLAPATPPAPVTSASNGI